MRDLRIQQEKGITVLCSYLLHISFQSYLTCSTRELLQTWFTFYHFLQKAVLAKQRTHKKWGIFSNSWITLKRKLNKLTYTLFLTPRVNKELVQEPPDSNPHLSARRASHLPTFCISTTTKQNQNFYTEHSAVVESWCLLRRKKKKINK